jgi:hypothetical protein
MNPNDERTELKELVLQNQRLLTENNSLLNKLHRHAVRGFWLNVAWILLFVVLPLLAVVKLVMPFYSSLESSSESLESQLNNLQEIQGLLEQQQR